MVDCGLWLVGRGLWLVKVNSSRMLVCGAVGEGMRHAPCYGYPTRGACWPEIRLVCGVVGSPRWALAC